MKNWGVKTIVLNPKKEYQSWCKSVQLSESELLDLFLPRPTLIFLLSGKRIYDFSPSSESDDDDDEEDFCRFGASRTPSRHLASEWRLDVSVSDLPEPSFCLLESLRLSGERRRRGLSRRRPAFGLWRSPIKLSRTSVFLRSALRDLRDRLSADDLRRLEIRASSSELAVLLKRRSSIRRFDSVLPDSLFGDGLDELLSEDLFFMEVFCLDGEFNLSWDFSWCERSSGDALADLLDGIFCSISAFFSVVSDSDSELDDDRVSCCFFKGFSVSESSEDEEFDDLGLFMPFIFPFVNGSSSSKLDSESSLALSSRSMFSGSFNPMPFSLFSVSASGASLWDGTSSCESAELEEDSSTSRATFESVHKQAKQNEWTWIYFHWFATVNLYWTIQLHI